MAATARHESFAAAHLPSVSAREFQRARVELLATAEHVEVAAWLLPLVAHPTENLKPAGAAAEAFAAIVRHVAERRAKEPALEEALAQLERWTSQRPHDDSIRLYDHVRRIDRTPFITLLEVSYGKALTTLATSWVSTEEIVADTRRLLDDGDATVELLLGRVRGHSRHFLGRLVFEAELRAYDDPAFAATLASAGARFLESFHGDTKAWMDPKAQAFELLGPEYRGSWWHLPAHIALAMASWS
jgi:hypothetical protein